MDSDKSELDELIASFVQSIERGEHPDREKLIADHPQQAAELRKFIENFDRMQATQPHAAVAVPRREPTTSPDAVAGTVIGGRYKLIENIGEGGMGSVWLAEQREPVRRKVAIKLIKPGMDSKQVLARFEAERQALALMDHPNIAKVFDGGLTEQGRPYFVMEYVKGVPLTNYCDTARLSLKERLQLFIPVCQAVQHAHHKGIVHRDLKPSNILICLYDGKSVPKIIDFGLAKAMHQPLTDASVHTAHGLMVGTPLYMSPEQAELNNLDVDTRTDIYSLGVVLYELLTGTTPLEREELRRAAANEVLRMIREVEPLKPSTRLSGSASLPSVAAQRSIDPRHLQKLLSGDLDWIVMKSLEKERSRRYDTANSLARDVERYLNEEAVEACPPSMSYRLRKLAYRYRVAVIGVGAVMLTLLAGIVGTTWGLFRASIAEQAATRSEQTAISALGTITKERDAKNEALNQEIAARAAERAARDLAERQLANGLLRPIGYRRTDERDVGELRCFADWATINDSRLKLRILEIAFEDPETALRVARRADRLAQVCVTLSPTRRAKAIEFLTTQQSLANVDPRIRIAGAWLATELGSSNLIALPEALRELGCSSTNNNSHPEFPELVKMVANRIPSLNAHQIHGIWDALIFVLQNSKNQMALHSVGNGLEALASHLDQNVATRSANMLIEVLEDSTDRFALEAAEKGLAALTTDLDADQIARNWEALIAILQQSTDRIVQQAAEKALVKLVPRLSQDQIARSVDLAIELLEESKELHVLQTAEYSLIAMTLRLTPDDRMHAGDALINLLDKSPHWEGLVFVGPYLNPDQASRAWDSLVAKSKNLDTMLAAVTCLPSLAPRIGHEQIDAKWNALIDTLTNSTNRWTIQTAGIGLGKLAPRLGPEQILGGWLALVDVLDNSTQFWTADAAGKGLASLTPKLSPEQFSPAGNALIAVLIRTTNRDTILAASKVLEAMAQQLVPDQIVKAKDALLAVLENWQDPIALKAAGNALVSLLPRLTAEESTRCGEALVVSLAKSQHWEGLVSFAPKLNSTQIARGYEALIAVLEKPTDEYAIHSAGGGLKSLAPHLSSGQILRSRDALINILKKTTDHNESVENGRGAQDASNKPPRSGGSRIFVQQMQAKNYYALQAAGNCLVALAQQLDPDNRVLSAEAMIESLNRVQRHEITKSLFEMQPYFESSTQDRIAAECLTTLLDYRMTDNLHLYNRESENPFPFAIMSINSPQALAKLLQHPACVGYPREWMLQRFEELVLHDGRREFLTLPSDIENQATTLPVRTTEESDLRTQPARDDRPARKFHNIHDVAAWIQMNWSDFDLETAQTVQWRSLQ